MIFEAIMGKVTEKFLSKGLQAAFGEESSGPNVAQITPPRFSPARVFASSPAGDADDATTFVDLYTSANFDDNLSDWEKRLTNYIKDDIVISNVRS
tara:strand:+ start:176 stop:463 length:288 start_codon:yes stop_codon:yes gene_type:complete